LHRALERASAVRLVVTFIREEVERTRRDLHFDTHLMHALEELDERDLDDLLDVVLLEVTEDDGVVDTIEEFGVEEPLHRLIDLVLHLRMLVATDALSEADTRLLLDVLRTDVRGHDN